jgi:hypothetical protein
MTITTATNQDRQDRHDEKLAKLAAARAEEKEARRLRREGQDKEAIATYDHARDLYADSGFAFDTGTDMADDVMRAIKRCDTIVGNLRHPKDQRPAATTPRPNCLACDKPLRRYKIDGRTFDDGTPREWGDYGDQRFCGLRCGWRWACQNTTVPRGKKS